MTPTSRRRCARVLLVLALMVSSLVATAGLASAAPRSGPQLSATTSPGVASEGTLASVHLAASGLDPSRPASLYKGRWSTSSSFRGWEYLYFRGVSVNADGTFSADEGQSEAGTYRYRLCQYYEGKTKNYWVCTNYAEVVV